MHSLTVPSADGTSHGSSRFSDPPSAQPAQQNFQPQCLFEVCWRMLSLADLFLDVRGLVDTQLRVYVAMASEPKVTSGSLLLLSGGSFP